MDLTDQIAEYLDHLAVERGASPHTLAGYSADLSRYDEFCRALELHDLAQVVPEHVGQFLRVEVTYTDEGLDNHSVASAATEVIGDLFNGTDDPETFQGTAGDDIAFGNGGNDVLEGFGGNDELYGGDGADRIIGGAGIDMIDGGAGNDVILNVGVEDDVTGGEGIDRITTAMNLVALSDDIERVDFFGTGNFNAIGNGSANRITSRAGDDTIDGGAGGDRMVGRAGDDTYFVDNAADRVIEEVGNGNDTVLSTVTFRVRSEVENITLIGLANTNVIGSGIDQIIDGNVGDNILHGNGGDDVINGGDGADQIYGGAGADTMNGGSGDDMFFNVQDIDIVSGGDGIDHMTTAMNVLALPADVEDVTFVGSGAFNFTGNDLQNHVIARAGSDMIDGGGGGDRMVGRGGDDTYIVDNVLDRVIEGAGNGTDTVLSSVDFRIRGGSHVEHAVLTGTGDTSLVGSNRGETLQGNAGNNALHGRGGNDILIGGAGDDDMWGGAGSDSFQFLAAIPFGNDDIFTFQDGVDTVDLSGLGVTAASFEADVVIGDALDGVSTEIIVSRPDGGGLTIEMGRITLRDVGSGQIDINDFTLA